MSAQLRRVDPDWSRFADPTHGSAPRPRKCGRADKPARRPKGKTAT